MDGWNDEGREGYRKRKREREKKHGWMESEREETWREGDIKIDRLLRLRLYIEIMLVSPLPILQ